VYAEERQNVILERARSQGRVDVAALAEEFDVTAETIRRDLDVLTRRNLVRRTHGGALPIDRLGFELGVSAREGLLTSEKGRIAKAALAELPEEGAIILDAGTTTIRLAELIPGDRELTIVTNSLPVATVLAPKANITLHLVGGRVRGRTLASVDDWAERALRDIFVDVAFVGTNGLSPAHGLTTPDRHEAGVKRAMLTAARRGVVLTDHTKIGNDAFARFADLRDIDVIITDTGLDAETATELEASGPKVVRA
jgi:DeoR family fructose operon transcriptional repressor